MVRKRIQFAQNFLKSRSLVERLILKTSINGSDTVYEIGPGDGIITQELARKAAKVIAIEIDQNLVDGLRESLKEHKNIEIHHGDFLDYIITSHKYKIFSNIPFNITSDIVRKILYSPSPAIDSYLIMQKEAASKFSGYPTETEFSVLAKPWFTFETIWDFQRTDFIPIPAVDVVLLHIKERNTPLVIQENAGIYKRFVKFGFGAWKKDLKTAYKDIFSYEQWKRLSRDNDFPIKATPTQLSFEQWIKVFEYFLTGVAADKKRHLP